MSDQVQPSEHQLNTLQGLTERVLALEALEAQHQQELERATEALKERENLMREVYHQTNNNMATICNLMYMQASRTNDERTRLILKGTETRVRTMALVQEKFYRAKNMTRLNLGELVKEISFLVYQSYQTGAPLVAIKFDLEKHILVNARAVIPVGIILHELISNAMKFAFPDGASGEIEVSLQRSAQHEIELIVRDNGIGLPEDFDYLETDSMGLYLVQILGERQLGGKVEVCTSQGSCWRIRFKSAS